MYRVLIVEDDKDFQKELATILEQELGYEASYASTVGQARKMLREAEKPFDLVTIDLELNQIQPSSDENETVSARPDTSGLSVIDHILKNPRGEICCIISGKSFTIDFHDQLKPFEKIIGGKFPKGRRLKAMLIQEVPNIMERHKKRNRKIFISYRRQDTEDISLRIRDELIDVFGKRNVFIDVHNINVGRDFRKAIHEFIASCDAILVIIGRQWLNITDDNQQRRLDDPEDLLKIEVSEGLKLNKVVIPILVHDADMPRKNQLPQEIIGLVDRHGIDIRSNDRFESDVKALIEQLENSL
jgi:CheY-like chemotaxis protein